MDDETTPTRTLELFVRSLSASATGVPIESVLERLDRLADGDYSVTVWGERVSTDPVVARTDAGAFVRNRVAEFEEWALANDASLEGGFETRTVHSAITGETHEDISLPVIALACRHDGDLEWVVPSTNTDSETTTTAMDRLSELASDYPSSTANARSPVPSDD